jgi:hypothetical protein
LADPDGAGLRFLGAAAFLSLMPPLQLRFISPRYRAVVIIPLVVLSAGAIEGGSGP